MKTYLMTAPENFSVSERAVPEIGEQEVLIRVKNIGLCGSDLHLYKGTYNGPKNYPMMFGHEWAGIIEKVGARVTKLKPGDLVTGDCSQYCGHCAACQVDRNLCSSIEKYGITTDGASAEYIVRPQMHCYKAQPDADLRLLALSEPIAVAKHLLERIQDQTGSLQGKRILVYGGGAIGQSALLLLREWYGCEDVFLSDLVPYRMQLARELGAKIPAPEELKWDRPNDYFNMYNCTRFDVIIETTGVPSVFANSLNLLRPLGVLGCVGMIANVELEQKLIVTKALSVIGSIGGTGEFEDVIHFIHTHKEQTAKLISHPMKIKDIREGFEVALDTKSAMKVVLEL